MILQYTHPYPSSQHHSINHDTYLLSIICTIESSCDQTCKSMHQFPPHWKTLGRGLQILITITLSLLIMAHVVVVTLYSLPGKALTMPSANSTPLGVFGAPLRAAAFYLCTIPPANSSLSRIIGAPLMAARFPTTQQHCWSTPNCHNVSLQYKLLHFGVIWCTRDDCNHLCTMLPTDWHYWSTSHCSKVSHDNYKLLPCGHRWNTLFCCNVFHLLWHHPCNNLIPE